MGDDLVNIEKIQASASNFLDRHGFSTAVCIFLFLVMIGALDSPITQNRDMLLESRKDLSEHRQETREESRKMNARLLATCVNPSLIAGDMKGARICLEENEYLQKKLIERAIETGENSKP